MIDSTFQLNKRISYRPLLLFVLITVCLFVSLLLGDECTDYNTLSARDRAADYFSYNTLKCDAYLPSGWYRLAGRAGTVMPTHCVPKMHCGTLSPGWLNGKHPTEGEGVVQRMVCFTKDNDCCHWYSLVLVKNCSGFMVYKFGPFPTGVDSCSLRYCGGGEAGEAGK